MREAGAGGRTRVRGAAASLAAVVVLGLALTVLCRQRPIVPEVVEGPADASVESEPAAGPVADVAPPRTKDAGAPAAPGGDVPASASGGSATVATTSEPRPSDSTPPAPGASGSADPREAEPVAPAPRLGSPRRVGEDGAPPGTDAPVRRALHSVRFAEGEELWRPVHARTTPLLFDREGPVHAVVPEDTRTPDQRELGLPKGLPRLESPPLEWRAASIAAVVVRAAFATPEEGGAAATRATLCFRRDDQQGFLRCAARRARARGRARGAGALPRSGVPGARPSGVARSNRRRAPRPRRPARAVLRPLAARLGRRTARPGPRARLARGRGRVARRPGRGVERRRRGARVPRAPRPGARPRGGDRRRGRAALERPAAGPRETVPRSSERSSEASRPGPARWSCGSPDGPRASSAGAGSPSGPRCPETGRSRQNKGRGGS